jgi:hypothetical protein
MTKPTEPLRPNPHLTWTPLEYANLRKYVSPRRFEDTVKCYVIPIAAHRDFPLSTAEIQEFLDFPEHFPHLHMVALRICWENEGVRGSGQRFYDAAEADVTLRQAAELETGMAGLELN